MRTDWCFLLIDIDCAFAECQSRVVKQIVVYYQGAVYRPKEGLEVVLVYSNEGVQDRSKIRKEPEKRIEQEQRKVMIAGIERLYGVI